MSRIGLQRHGAHGEPAEDPLEGLVNLFDLGLVLAVAFLVAGLSIGAGATTEQAASSTPQGTTVQLPSGGRTAQGAGTAVGTVYKLPDGTLVLQDEAAAPSTP